MMSLAKDKYALVWRINIASLTEKEDLLMLVPTKNSFDRMNANYLAPATPRGYLKKFVI